MSLPRGPSLKLQRYEIERERVLRKAVNRQGGLAIFTRLCWSGLDGQPGLYGVPLLWAPHHTWICDELEKVARMEVRQLVICVPPRSLKTILSAVFFPAWNMLWHPEKSVINATITETKAEESATACRDLVRSALYAELKEIAVKHHGRDAWKLRKDGVLWETDRGGRYQGIGVDSQAIGAGAHLQIIDDLLDPKTLRWSTPERALALCEAAQSFVWNYLTTRLNDPNKPQRVLIAQRVHEADPPGRALREGWRSVVLPMRAEPDRPGRYELDTRPAGALLHTARVDETAAAELETSLGEWASAQLQQNPTPGKGGLLDAEWLNQRYDEDPEDIARTCDELVISADAAKKPTGSSDFHGIQVWGKRGSRKYLLDYATARMGYPDFEAEMDRLIRRWAPILVGRVLSLIEDTANGTTYLQVRAQAWIPAREVAPGQWEVAPQIPLIPFHPSRDTPGDDKSKPARFLYFVRSAQAREVWTPNPTRYPWVRVWMAAMVGFPKTAHDDDADATSQCFLRWATMGGGLDAFLQFMGG